MISRPGRLVDLTQINRFRVRSVLGTSPAPCLVLMCIYDPMKRVFVFESINDNCKCPFTYLYRKGQGLWGECKEYACMDSSYDCNNKYINSNSLGSARIGTLRSSNGRQLRLHRVTQHNDSNPRSSVRVSEQMVKGTVMRNWPQLLLDWFMFGLGD